MRAGKHEKDRSTQESYETDESISNFEKKLRENVARKHAKKKKKSQTKFWK